MRIQSLIDSGLGCVLASVLAFPAMADPIRYAFTAEVNGFTADSGYDSSYTGPVVVGDTVTGFLQYDPDIGGDPRTNGGASRVLSAQVGNASLFYDGIGNFINISNDRSVLSAGSSTFNNVDAFQITIDLQGEAADLGYSPGINIYLIDTDQSVFSDTSLPATLSLVDFEEGLLSIRWISYRDGLRRSNEGFSLSADILTLTEVAVPEPTTLAVMGAGVALLIRRRRYRGSSVFSH